MTDRQFFVRSLFVVATILGILYKDVVYYYAPRRPLRGSERRFAAMEVETEAMRQAIGGVDPALLAELERRGAFAAMPLDVPLTAAEIAALGGAYLRLDPGLGAPGHQ